MLGATITRQSKPTQILLAGALAAILAYGLGQFFVFNAQSKLHALRAECEKPDKYSELAKEFGGSVLCDPIELMRREDSTQPASGISAQLISAQEELWVAQRWPLKTSGILLSISTLPWLWYFFLRRVRELRNTIVGK